MRRCETNYASSNGSSDRPANSAAWSDRPLLTVQSSAVQGAKSRELDHYWLPQKECRESLAAPNRLSTSFSYEAQSLNIIETSTRILPAIDAQSSAVCSGAVEFDRKARSERAQRLAKAPLEVVLSLLCIVERLIHQKERCDISGKVAGSVLFRWCWRRCFSEKRLGA